ncbi:MAG: biotin--[acetyl-CoA-carboxylase] ligase [Brumimicrobium sp.]
MKNSLINRDYIFFPSVSSTNDYALEKMKSGEIKSGTVIVADHQTSGKGQRGKSWISAPGESLMMSIAADLDLWDIKNVVSLNHIVSLAIQNFLLNFIEDTRIKWPNDIMVNDKKICGILIESKVSMTKRHSVVGIGLNLNQESFELNRATSFYIETGQKALPQNFIEPILQLIEEFIMLYHVKGEDFVLYEYNNQLWKLKDRHTFKYSLFKREGWINKTTMSGDLVVHFDNEDINFQNGTVIY